MTKKINTENGDSKGYADVLWEESWTHIKTVVDTVREPLLVLDKDLCIMAANQSFYQTFQVEQKETEGKLVYKLGNGQWNIPSLKKLLENILPKNSFFRGFEVKHNFPLIGRKIMILNARQIYHDREDGKRFPPIILLAMEDVTDIMDVADMLARRTGQFEKSMADRTNKMELKIKIL